MVLTQLVLHSGPQFNYLHTALLDKSCELYMPVKEMGAFQAKNSSALVSDLPYRLMLKLLQSLRCFFCVIVPVCGMFGT